MLRFINQLIVIFLFTTTSVFAASSSAALSELLNSVQSMQANFTQTIKDTRGKKGQSSTGKMALQRPGKFRWEIIKPMPQLIIANQQKLWIYDPDLEQVTIRSLKGSSDETPALLLSHDNAALDSHFDISMQEDKASGWQWFKLKPKKTDNMFNTVQIGFQNKHLQEMQLEDNLGNVTLIVFSKLQTNPSLSASLFTFKARANVDVIDETRKK